MKGLHVSSRANEKVIEFIDNFSTLFGQFQEEEIDAVCAIFSRGFCYYFAIILKNAFNGRGEIYMTSDHRHIVWVLDNVAYDINGVYRTYPRSANNGNFYNGELVSIAMLPNYMESFKHVVPGTTKKGMAEINAVQKLMDVQKDICDMKKIDSFIEKGDGYKTISINGVEGRVICDSTKITKPSSRKEDDNGTKRSD